MAALEQSLDVPALVTRLTGANAARDQVVARAKELMDKELLTLADDIATHPEIGFEEKRSVSKLTDYLRQHNFSVETGTAGLSTAFVAKFKRNNGSPVLGVILEYDALRGTKGAFHGDQHSAQGPVGMAAAIAMAEYLTRTRSRRQRRRLRHARRGDDAAQREDGDARGACVRRRRHHRPQPRVEHDVAAGARLRLLLPEHRRGEVHVRRRADAPDDAVERPQRAARR